MTYTEGGDEEFMHDWVDGAAAYGSYWSLSAIVS